MRRFWLRKGGGRDGTVGTVSKVSLGHHSHALSLTYYRSPSSARRFASSISGPPRLLRAHELQPVHRVRHSSSPAVVLRRHHHAGGVVLTPSCTTSNRTLSYLSTLSFASSSAAPTAASPPPPPAPPRSRRQSPPPTPSTPPRRRRRRRWRASRPVSTPRRSGAPGWTRRRCAARDSRTRSRLSSPRRPAPPAAAASASSRRTGRGRAARARRRGRGRGAPW